MVERRVILERQVLLLMRIGDAVVLACLTHDARHTLPLSPAPPRSGIAELGLYLLDIFQQNFVVT